VSGAVTVAGDRVPTVVTVGNFDGVHRGHLMLVARTVALAGALGARAVALTFDPHPATLLRPDQVPLALQSVEERVAMLRAHGLDEVVVLPFDAELAAMDAGAFVREVLVDRLGATTVVVGENFRFGAGARGDVALLRHLGADLGVSVEAVTLVADDATVLSSSAVRARLVAGDVVGVAHALGRPFTLAGEVTRGDGRGRTIGVPTANVAVAPGRALPADGVYACRAVAATGSARGEDHPAVVNVGWRPTFAGTTRTVEAHLLDAPAGLDLYGAVLTLSFIARIRGEQRFDGPDALVARIREDVHEARRILADPR
jgi:riboflavin kinase / FMN adenylyltransferase